MSVHLSNERMIVILLVGALAGWLIGKVLRGNGFGLVGDAAIGVVGALIGAWLLPRGSGLSRKAFLYGVRLAKQSRARVRGLTLAEPSRAPAMDAVLVPVDE